MNIYVISSTYNYINEFPFANKSIAIILVIERASESVVRTYYVDFEVNTEINVPNRSVANACRREGRKTETAAMEYHVSPCDFSIPMQAYNENRHRRKRRPRRETF